MAEDLLEVHTRFHREVVVPDVQRIVDARVSPLREEMLERFDGAIKKLERLEMKYQSLNAALPR